MKKLFFILIFTLALIPGCIGPELILGPIVNGLIVWIDGEAHKYYGYDSDVIYRAVTRALYEMNFPIKQDDPPENGDFYLISGENNILKIKILNVDVNVSKLSVRVDFMGNKPYAELFYKKVNQQLHIIKFKDGKPVSAKEFHKKSSHDQTL